MFKSKTAEVAEPLQWTGQRWEYKAVGNVAKRSEDYLNGLGEQGWELAGVHKRRPLLQTAKGISHLDTPTAAS
jgi:hypothetical protein